MTDLNHLVGCDFSSSPTRQKPIVIALGSVSESRVLLKSLERLESLDAFESWLKVDRPWIGGFDLPFGLPRELVETLDWPLTWKALIHHYASLARPEIRERFIAFCDARPVGGKFAHRKCDLPAGSSSSMKWVNPPVAYMLHAGVPRLIAANVHFPGLDDNDRLTNHDLATSPNRVALEAYPGLLAREILGQRSYKSDSKSKQTPERLIARKDLITAMELGNTRLGLRLKVTHAQRDTLAADPSGDSLDAVLCLVQAAWAATKGAPRYGLPMDMDSLEGWIVTA